MNKKKKSPAPGAEYITAMLQGLPFVELLNNNQREEYKTETVPFGTIVNEVTTVENTDGDIVYYDYTIKETGKRGRTYYGWALAINTSENQEALSQYEKEFWKLHEMEKKVEEMRKKIKTLE